jgi:hypothetical protein
VKLMGQQFLAALGENLKKLKIYDIIIYIKMEGIFK